MARVVAISYGEILDELKSKIELARQKAAFSVNRELILLYWEIGRTILKQQKKEGWGAKIIDRLSKDLTRSFPDMRGVSPRNLKYMRQFAQLYPDFTIVQDPLAQLTWYHIITLMDKVKDEKKRLWYAHQAIRNGWSRNILVHQMETDLYQRQGGYEKITNFKNTLPPPQSDLAQQTLKDPYVFDFLAMTYDAKELEIHKELVRHITKFLLELGTGFAFVGSQYHLEVSGKDFYIDLLFYHLNLRCYVVIELKTGDFKPEYAGQLNFYLSAVDSRIKGKEDNPTIGIILCKNKNKIVAEYALRNLAKPMGVAEYKLLRTIPEKLRKALPSPKEIQSELGGKEK